MVNKTLIKELKPFWKELAQVRSKYWKKLRKIEKRMNKKVSIDIPLEFFYCDGECCGIGAERYGDRDKFPLIFDSDLE